MKKLILFGLILFTALLPAKSVEARQNWFDSPRPALWRSTEVCHALNFVVLTTSASVVHQIRVTSATVNALSSYNLFNSTARPISDNAANFVSTGTRKLSYTNVAPAGIPSWKDDDVGIWLDVFYSSGIVVNKPGAACVELLWDYNDHKTLERWFP
mgnify:CR=1 FL=1